MASLDESRAEEWDSPLPGILSWVNLSALHDQAAGMIAQVSFEGTSGHHPPLRSENVTTGPDQPPTHVSDVGPSAASNSTPFLHGTKPEKSCFPSGQEREHDSRRLSTDQGLSSEFIPPPEPWMTPPQRPLTTLANDASNSDSTASTISRHGPSVREGPSDDTASESVDRVACIESSHVKAFTSALPSTPRRLPTPPKPTPSAGVLDQTGLIVEEDAGNGGDGVGSDEGTRGAFPSVRRHSVLSSDRPSALRGHVRLLAPPPLDTARSCGEAPPDAGLSAAPELPRSRSPQRGRRGLNRRRRWSLEECRSGVGAIEVEVERRRGSVEGAQQREGRAVRARRRSWVAEGLRMQSYPQRRLSFSASVDGGQARSEAASEEPPRASDSSSQRHRGALGRFGSLSSRDSRSCSPLACAFEACSSGSLLGAQELLAVGRLRASLRAPSAAGSSPRTSRLKASEALLPEPALAEELRRFCRETGGGKGTWCAGEQVFGLGICKWGQLDPQNRRVWERAWNDGEGVDAEETLLPPGFGEGREPYKGPQADKQHQEFSRFVAGREGAVAFGRVSWDDYREPVNYVRVTTDGDPGLVPQLLRFFAENVWGLARPRLLISVFGSSVEMDLKLEHQKKLSAIMHVAVEARAFVVTNGLDSGVSKFVADARKEVDNSVPVIGVAPWGLVEGRQALWETEGDGRLMSHNEKLPVEDFKAAEQAFSQLKPGTTTSARLSPDHSHLVLVDDGSAGEFGGEAAIRAAFEQALCSADLTMQTRIEDCLKREGLGWQLAALSGEESQGRGSSVASVSLCVQGGEASIIRVFETIKNGTPVVLARGTGRAADLMSDTLLLHRRGATYTDDNSFFAESVLGSKRTDQDELLSLEAKYRALDDDKSQDHINVRMESIINEARYGIVTGILQRESDEDDAELMIKIQKTYSISKFRNFEDLAQKLQEIAKSPLVQIMDMDREDDMGGAMLLAILKKERQNGMEWKDCLQLIVVWNHVEIMKRTLSRLQEDAAVISVSTRRAVENAFHLAVKTNKTSMIYCILEYWDCTELAYNIKNTGGCQGRFWSTALLSIKQRNRKVSKPVRLWAGLVTRMLKEWNTSEGVLAYQRWSDLHETSMMDDEVRKLAERARAGSGLDGVGAFRSAKKEGHLEQRQREAMQVKDLELVYKCVLGENFWYETSVLGCEMDLFLWSLLMRRKSVVKMLWARMNIPVRSLLLASTMYRRWVKVMDLKAHLKEQLLEDAREYEQMAVEVQTFLMRADSNIAMLTLERPSRLWKGQTGVDLAVLGENTEFVEKCCAEAFDCRWTGDINPYDQSLGLYPTVFLCVLSLGLLAPDLIVFRPPPRSEALRAPSQRIRIPKLYEDATDESYLDRGRLKAQRVAAIKLQKLNHTTGTLSKDSPMRLALADERGSVQAPWGERLYLFFNAPVTLFMVDAMQQIFYNCIFTNFVLVAHEHAGDLTWAETILCWSVLSTSISDFTQVLLDGAREYFSNSWNWFRVFACGFFWVGLLIKLRGSHGNTLVAERCYSVSLFFMWMQVLHLLSVHKALGPLVIAFSRMRDDVVMFATIWSVLLLAFSCAMHGAGLTTQYQRAAASAGNPMHSWDSWWLVRTYFQSFGEPFFDELTTDETNVVTIIMWPVMNLMLVNLLIAIMNDTYLEVKHQSRLQWMVQMYYIAKEYRSPSRLNVIMLVCDLVNFLRRQDEIDRRTKKLLARQVQSPGIRGWLESMRFKFRKFQSRDLPAYESSEIEKELQRRLAEMEERETRSQRRGSVEFGSEEQLAQLRTQLKQAGWSGVSFCKSSHDKKSTPSLMEVKSKLKRKLLMLKVQKKQDQDALRTSEKRLLQAKNDFVNARAADFLFDGTPPER